MLSCHKKKMNVKEFISEIRKRPCLWDARTSAYRTKTLVDREWANVAKMFSVEVRVAKTKWKNLRDTYRSELKKNWAKRDDMDRKSPWSNFEDMQFLRNVLKTRQYSDLISSKFENETLEESSFEGLSSTSDFCRDGDGDIKMEAGELECINTDSEVGEEETFTLTGEEITEGSLLRSVRDDFEEEQNESPPAKKRILEMADDDLDADWMFMKSLLPFVRKLSDQKKLKFRMDVQQRLYKELYSDSDCSRNRDEEESQH